MSKYLMVPVRLDALVVSGEEMMVVDQAANFHVLPYFDRAFKEEINCETANISESIVSQPFQNKNLRLGHGIHLHWALPDALTRGSSGLQFPEVPNRWLVTRRRSEQIDKQWVVESDYLYPPNINKKGTAVSIPYISEHWKKKQGADKEKGPDLFKYEALTGKEDEAEYATRAAQPYRYLGRKMPLTAWQERFADAEYYPNLTAIGYGEPTFAAFYPNCYSVFGFHDKQPGKDLKNIRYEVAGWYGDEKNDIVVKLTAEIEEDKKKGESTDLKEELSERFNWHMTKEEALPDRLLCYGGLNFATNTVSENPIKDKDMSVTVANTPTEALSACLADRLKENDAQLETIEDQLEAMQLSFRLDEKELDTVSRFKELRHENGFTAIGSSHLWAIRKETVGVNGNEEEASQPGDAVVLPDHIAEALNRINKLQKEYDSARHEIEYMRKQLFSDWYKYMICVYPPDIKLHDYPDPDLVKYFIQSKVLKPLNRKLATAGEIAGLFKDKNNEDIIRGIKISEDSNDSSLAKKLALKIEDLISIIDTFTNKVNTGNKNPVHFLLEQVPGPRYWQPNNPVLLMEGEAAAATKRHGEDGELTCHIFDTKNNKLFTGPNDFSEMTKEISILLKPGSFGLNTWERQPWNPFLLEWQTRLFPAKTKGNLHLNTGFYDGNFITDNYEAPVLNPDLEFKPGRGAIVDAGKTYVGQSILTSQANLLLKKLLEKELIDKLELFEKAGQISAANYKGKANLDNPEYTMIRAYEELGKMNILAQSLNGFNEALLMHKQTMELAIDDPMGFPGYRSFTSDKVDDSMGNNIRIAPSPLNSFNPIRSGCLKLINLRLVDTFGQIRDMDTDKIDTTYKMTTDDSPYLIKLPPRLVQPARLNFRWLNAVKNQDETNSHTATTPICGWLLPNILDKSIMFYDAWGKALGYFKAGKWHEAIDSDEAKTVKNIKNLHLRRVAEFVEISIKKEKEKKPDEDSKFIDHFIGTINDALENIEPEKNTSMLGAAMLMGRPVAVVRASLNLELCSSPAVNQDWNVFRCDMAKNTRTSDDFTKVQFPVRLGEYGQLNDGLIGYWLEKIRPDGTIHFATEEQNEKGEILFIEDNVFYSPQSDYIDCTTIESAHKNLSDAFPQFDNKPINFYQGIEDAPQTVTMLMDVQGTVHVTAGILPNKEISIPEEQYTEALQNIEVSFLHAPLLTEKGKIILPLRPVSDYEWSWVERKENDTWTEYFPENRIDKKIFVTQWQKTSQKNNGEDLWNYLLGSKNDSINWLAAVDDDEDGQTDSGRAKIASKDDRIETRFADHRFKDQENLVETILETYSEGIDPPMMDAVFTGPQEMKEGWLKLRKR
jgi:hypothetical protein